MRICPECSELFPPHAAFCPFDGKPLTSSNDPYLGRTVAGRFRLTRRIGAGGMSFVYLARHVLIDRLSAIKILREDVALNAQLRERFLREARAVNRIHHPNIVEVTDLGELDGVPYLIMEYVDGPTVLSVLSHGPLDWRRAASIGASLAGALGRTHEAGVIHRDVKPENVLLGKPLGDEEERVKLTDFGVAKMLDAPSLTLSEQVVGTPGYIAPEYLEGREPDGRADLYALGVLLYEMTSGKLPYGGTGASELLLRPLTSTPNVAIERLTNETNVPEELADLLLQLLQRNRDDRPASAFLVEERLRRLLGVQKPPPSIPPPSMIPPPPGSMSRDEMATVVDAVVPVDNEDLTSVTSVGRRTELLNARWVQVIHDLERSTEAAMLEGGNRAWLAARARVFAEQARRILNQLDRAAELVARAQARMDMIEGHARQARDRFGRAIDQLALDRARSSSEHEAEDLTFQIGALQGRLDEFNEAFEERYATAASELEGGISAYRQIQSELVRSLDDGARILDVTREAPITVGAPRT